MKTNKFFLVAFAALVMHSAASFADDRVIPAEQLPAAPIEARAHQALDAAMLAQRARGPIEHPLHVLGRREPMPEAV